MFFLSEIFYSAHFLNSSCAHTYLSAILHYIVVVCTYIAHGE